MLVEALAARTMPIATGVVDRHCVAAAVADMHVTAERSRTTALNRAQGCVLLRAQHAAIPQRGAKGPRDVADLHARLIRRGAAAACSRKRRRHGLLAQDAALFGTECFEW